MYRDVQHLPLEVPQGDVDDAEQPDRKLLRTVELPQPVPEPLAPIGPFADEFLPEHAVDDVVEHRATPLVVRLAHRALLGADPQNGGLSSLSGTTEAPPPRERRGHRGEGN